MISKPIYQHNRLSLGESSGWINVMIRFLLTIMLVSVSAPSSAAPTAPSKKSTHVYKVVNGLEIRADVFSYADAKSRPVVVWFHGGALINGGRGGVSGVVRKFASDHGYVLVSFDYRLAPESKLPAIIEDLEDAFRWLRREGPQLFHIDPQRIAVTGGSAGGYLTLTAGFRVQPPPQVLLAFWGYGDLVGDWYSKPSPHARHRRNVVSSEEALKQVSGPPIANSKDRPGNGGMFYQHCRQQGSWPKMVSTWDPISEPERYFPFMPVKNVSPKYPPTVLIHGTKDTDVPFEQSVMMANEFKANNVSHLFLKIENGEHGLGGANRADVIAAQAKALEFVNARLSE
jgi:acetyl esterase/lipase